jgi:hypothetical protein
MSDPPMGDLKQCAKCEDWFAVSLFRTVKKTGRLASYCRECGNANSREHYAENKEKAKEYKKARQDKETLSSIKKRAKQKGLDFDLEVEDILGTSCPIFGVELKRGSRQGPSDFAPSVDRIDNSKGYVKGNVQVLSNLANKMKANATPEQLLQFAEWVFKTYKKQ